MVTLTPSDLRSTQNALDLGFEAPLVRRLPPNVQLSDVFLRLCHLPHCIWMDSAKRFQNVGRYSFLTADPVDLITIADADGDPFARLAPYTPFLDQAPLPGLPPFQGGLAGVLGYDLGQHFEAIPKCRFDDLHTPHLCMGFYDWAICFDHLTDQGWIICQGWPEQDPHQRRRAAANRYAQVQWWLDRTPATLPLRPISSQTPDLAPQFSTPLDSRLTSNFSSDGFRCAVDEVVDYIRRGDVFQVNLAQRLLYPDRQDPASLYLRMRSRNPAPFAGYFDGGPWQLISASPERFLRIRGRSVETRPIKGTCPRTGDDAIDQHLGDRLLGSEKDRAENVMIVDLMRNDLSRVCRDDDVDVTQLCGLEQYECVQHLVSVVQGRLRDECTIFDLLRASFPGGSITGAPKVRAMEIIAELEPTVRGLYCGSMGYLSTGGHADFSILIRSAVVKAGWLQIPVGGGITSRSSPVAEERETWDKAEGMLRAIL